VGTPVTLSGFNGIDFNQLLDAVMTQERAPLTRLETQKTTLETQNTALGTLAGKLSAMQTAVDALRDTQSLSLLTATSSDTGVGVSTTSGSTAGTYSLVVNELARAQVMTSTSTYAATTDVVATGGSMTFTKSGGSPVAVTLTGSTTLQGLADKINATTDIPVTASVVQSAPGTYRLMLTAKDTGVSNEFTFTKTLTGGGGVTFTDTDTDGTYGETAADNTQTALDASLTVNGLTVTSVS
jgi:flagellar hook-associated protein 2